MECLYYERIKMLKNIKRIEEFLYQIQLPKDTINSGLEHLEKYRQHFFKWNQTHSLSRIQTQEEWVDYCLDCLYPLSFISPLESVLDVGSGSGIPALVWAVFFPHIPFVLVESKGKKVAFLKIATLSAGLKNVSIQHSRIEDLNFSNSFKLITFRAVGSIQTCLQLIAHLRQRDILLFKGQSAMQETYNSKTHHFKFYPHGRMLYLYHQEGENYG